MPVHARAPFSTAPFHATPLAPGVYLVAGDTGRGSEGRPNAGFVVTPAGVAVIDALASPWEARQLLATIRATTAAPVRWLILTHHHPDHMMGAIVFRRLGAAVIAHPDRAMQAGEHGDGELLTDWTRVVGRRELEGFAFADAPTVPVTRDTTLDLGARDGPGARPGRTIVLLHPRGAAHSPGDLAVWIPDARVLFAGDLLVEDGVAMVVDGSSADMRAALTRLDSLGPRVVVPGHGRLAADARTQILATEHYLDSLRLAMRSAVDRGTPLTRVLRAMPPPDTGRPVSLASRRQRNAERVYLEMERAAMGIGPSTGTGPHAPPLRVRDVVGPQPPPPLATLISTDSLAALLAGGRAGQAITIVDTRPDEASYLRSHIPGAVYVGSETLRAMSSGVPNLLLPASSYVALFSGLGIRADRPVVIYSAGEIRNSDATYLAWILSGFGMPAVAILDGGFSKWELEARPTSTALPPPLPGAFPDRPFDPARATLADVRRYLDARRTSAEVGGADAHGDERSTVLVDARVADQYSGQSSVQPRRGHIPGAVNHPWDSDLADGLAHTFKPLDVIRASYVAQGITPDRAIVTYCNTGRESSHVYFVLHDLLHYPRVRVYDGSYSEYAAHPELPVRTGTAP